MLPVRAIHFGALANAGSGIATRKLGPHLSHDPG